MKKGSCLPNIFSQVIYSGGYSDGEPPLPIPNREAKPVIADGTARPGGRVGSRRAWKESSDERSSGDSFSCLQVSCENIRCTRHMAMRVSLWTVLMTEPCLSVSLFCRIFSLCHFRGCLRSYVLMRSELFRTFAFQCEFRPS